MVVLISGAALAGDVLLKNAGANIGPVTSLNCMTDGGVLCARDAGSVGTIWCNPASATEKGCVSTVAQTFAGDKTFTGNPRIVGAAHASLPACSSGVKGTWSTCTTHNAPVFCDGSNNVEFFGSSTYVTLGTLFGQRLFYAWSGAFGQLKLPYAYTVSSVSGQVTAGVGAAATINLRFTGASLSCDCAVHCDTAVIDACTGNCTFAANTLVTAYPSADGCTTPPTLWSDLTVAGYK